MIQHPSFEAMKFFKPQVSSVNPACNHPRKPAFHSRGGSPCTSKIISCRSWVARSSPKQRTVGETCHPMIVGRVFPKNRATPKWMVYMENPIKMDDSGVPLFSETSSYVLVIFCLMGWDTFLLLLLIFWLFWLAKKNRRSFEASPEN